MTASLNRLGQVLLGIFLVVALAIGYWGIVRQTPLLSREDNPRRVLEEQRIRRGLIVDRNNTLLAGSLTDEATGISTRHYPYPEAAPVVGYYSIRHGVGGIEEAYDDVLRGTDGLSPAEQVFQTLLHRPQIGGDIRLTLNYMIQQNVDALLDEHRGAIVLITIPQGEILALASRPAFDPNHLDEQWDSLSSDPDAPLLNRATQALYQPGTILQTAVLGAALDTNTTIPSSMWGEVLSTRVDGSILPCAAAPQDMIDSLTGALFWACPSPFEQLGLAMGSHRLNAVLSSFGLFEPPVFALPTSGPDSDVVLQEGDSQQIAIGQSSLTVTPLHMAQMAAAFANHGEIPALRLVQAVRIPGEGWQTVQPEGYRRGTISRASADSVAQLMGQTVSTGAAAEAAIEGHRVYGHVGLALAGPEGNFNAWFIGFVNHPNGQSIAVAVLLEDERDATRAAYIGGRALEAALNLQP